MGVGKKNRKTRRVSLSLFRFATLLSFASIIFHVFMCYFAVRDRDLVNVFVQVPRLYAFDDGLGGGDINIPVVVVVSDTVEYLNHFKKARR